MWLSTRTGSAIVWAARRPRFSSAEMNAGGQHSHLALQEVVDARRFRLRCAHHRLRARLPQRVKFFAEAKNQATESPLEVLIYE